MFSWGIEPWRECETEVEVSESGGQYCKALVGHRCQGNRSERLYAPIAGKPQHVEQGVRGRQGLAFNGQQKRRVAWTTSCHHHTGPIHWNSRAGEELGYAVDRF